MNGARLGGKLLVGLFALAAAASVLLYTNGRWRSAPESELPRLFSAPAFALTSEEGLPVSSAAYAGKVWIADFIFTRCGGSCPGMTLQMASLGRQLANEPGVSLVSFDVDPEHDSVADLANYAKNAGADPARWSFLRGDRPTIKRISREGFKLGLEEGNPDDLEPILHSTRFVLVDRAGFVRGTYDGTNPAEVKRLAKDALRLAREGPR